VFAVAAARRRHHVALFRSVVAGAGVASRASGAHVDGGFAARPGDTRANAGSASLTDGAGTCLTGRTASFWTAAPLELDHHPRQSKGKPKRATSSHGQSSRMEPRRKGKRSARFRTGLLTRCAGRTGSTSDSRGRPGCSRPVGMQETRELFRPSPAEHLDREREPRPRPSWSPQSPCGIVTGTRLRPSVVLRRGLPMGRSSAAPPPSERSED
jgi:hypothetical protein